MKDYKGTHGALKMQGRRAETYWSRRKKRKTPYNNSESEHADYNYENALEGYFKFGGIEYGNWMTNSDRADRCQALCDELEKLEKVIKTKNFGMDGALKLCFGGRGQGGRVVAHFEPWDNTINLTKTHKGSFVHEWTHAVDYIVGRNVDRSQNGLLSDGGSSPLREYANKIVQFRRQYPLPANNIAYYAKPTEILARTMEDYIAHKMKVQTANILVKSVKEYEAYPVVYCPKQAQKELFKLCGLYINALARTLNM